MEIKNDIEQNNSGDIFEQFNLGLLLFIVKRTLPYIILLMLVVGISVEAYLRYTPSIYQSASTLMRKTQKTTQLLGITEMLREDRTEIQKEVQLLSSRLIVEKAVCALPMQISYFKIGRTGFIRTELYKSNPFKITDFSISDGFNDIVVDFTALNESDFEIEYDFFGEQVVQKGSIGVPIETPHFKGTFKWVTQYESKHKGRYAFVFNSKAKLVDDLRSKVSIQPLNPKTQTVKVVLNDANKTKALDVVSEITSSFIAYDKERKAESVQSIIGFLENQVDTFGSDFQSVQDSFIAFRIGTGFASPDQKITTISEKLAGLEKTINQLTLERNTLVWLQEGIVDDKPLEMLSLSYGNGGNPFNNDVQELAALENRKNQLLLDVTTEHPEVILLEKRIKNNKIKLLEQLNFRIESTKRQLAMVINDENKLKNDMLDLPMQGNQYNKLSKQNARQENFIAGLQDVLSQYLIARAGIVSDYVILQTPSVSFNPVAPIKNQYRGIGVAICLLLSLLAIATQYFIHNKILSPKEVERVTGLPLIGVVPAYSKALDKPQIAVTENPKSIISEAFRSIRSNFQFFLNSTESKIIATTSTVSGEGKTFVSSNLAAILSLMDKKVIIIDLDMRRPKLQRVFNVSNTHGMSTVLIGKTPIENSIRNSGNPNLDYITAGPIPPNPAELIMLPIMQKILYYLKNNYDFIIIDTPPVGIVTDATDIMQLCDHLVYVFRADYSDKQFLEIPKRLKNEHKVENISTLLNDLGRGASSNLSGLGFNYGYGYGYGNGYGYYMEDEEEKPSFFKRLFNRKG